MEVNEARLGGHLRSVRPPVHPFSTVPRRRMGITTSLVIPREPKVRPGLGARQALQVATARDGAVRRTGSPQRRRQVLRERLLELDPFAGHRVVNAIRHACRNGRVRPSALASSPATAVDVRRPGSGDRSTTGARGSDGSGRCAGWPPARSPDPNRSRTSKAVAAARPAVASTRIRAPRRAERGVDREPLVRHRTANQREVSPFDVVPLEQGGERLVGLVVGRHDEQSRGAGVEPVDDPWAKRSAARGERHLHPEQPVHQRARPTVLGRVGRRGRRASRSTSR